MRPRRIRRGWFVLEQIGSAGDSFNEAPANSPGMDARRMDGRGDPYRFNEAPANSPGMARCTTGPSPKIDLLQ